MGGLLVDVHPVARHRTLQLEVSGTWVDIGAVERTRAFLSDVTRSEAVLARTVDAGLFKRVTSNMYERFEYVESAADWNGYLEHPKTRGFTADEAVLAEGLRRLDAGDECLRVHSEAQLGTYARLP